jgi:hypothetical protein
MLKKIRIKIENILDRKDRYIEARKKLPSPITHKFICKDPTLTLTKYREYFGYISSINPNKKSIFAHNPIRVNILNDYGRHIILSIDRFDVKEL